MNMVYMIHYLKGLLISYLSLFLHYFKLKVVQSERTKKYRQWALAHGACLPLKAIESKILGEPVPLFWYTFV